MQVNVPHYNLLGLELPCEEEIHCGTFGVGNFFVLAMSCKGNMKLF